MSPTPHNTPPVWPAVLSPITALDLEVDRQGQIRHVGAIRDDAKTFEQKGLNRRNTESVLRQLDDFCRPARFILGHNLIDHDLLKLRAVSPGLAILQKPVIDTLFLSPLAFPRNPYHSLVKDYKIVRDSMNDPVKDASLAMKIFADEYLDLQALARKKPELLRFYHHCFATPGHSDATQDFKGLATVCWTLVDHTFSSDWEAMTALTRLGKEKACPEQLRRVAQTHYLKGSARRILPYAVAWLQVAGGNSILPHWVRHRYPVLSTILEQLRETHCGQEDCIYCKDNHDPKTQLRSFFQFPDFRVTDDGQPLQRDLVRGGMQGRSLLGIMPTSGGKSVCFQVPALTRYYRRGLLTVVISPLQALMRDQVESLKAKTGTNAVAAVYGLLTPPERGAILEDLRLGDIGLLYIAPEQLRNKSVTRVLAQREIGCWVFDEAHCLSKWGHDFRPDYLYCARFIREQVARNQDSLPPIVCFTATANKEVVEDIRQHFKEKLGCELELHQAGVERSNLQFEVHLVTKAAKHQYVTKLIGNRLPVGGSCIVYCATRLATKELAESLVHAGQPADYFHGGLEAPVKKGIMDRFMQDEVRVICSTNAFGMGVDKENVRLVIHAEVPGSLENYLQEAGRAGRDGETADCLLLFDEQDIENQFRLGARSELSQRDIQQMLRGIRKREKRQGQDVVITSGELLRSDEVNTSFDLEDSMADTKVKTAVAWLERSGFMERNENSNQVFQGKPLFANLEEAADKLDRLNLSRFRRRQWERLLAVLINAEPDEGVDADYLAEQLGRMQPGGDTGQLQTHEVIANLNQMALAGLVSDGLLMTAFLRPKGKQNARGVYEKLRRLEQRMLKVLYEENPDAGTEEGYPLNLRLLNQQLLDAGLDYSNPKILRTMLRSLATDGKGLAGTTGSIEFDYKAKDLFHVRLCRSWPNIKKTMRRRQDLAGKILDALYQAICPEEQSSQSEVLVEFSLQNLLGAIKSLTLKNKDKEMAALERGLLYLHEQSVIILQQGLAVFRQAMTLQLNPEARRQRYNQGDYEPLALHYKARVAQVHVMNEYALLGMEDMIAALSLVRDYFAQSNVAFLNRHFKGRRELLQLATSQRSLKDIVESLGYAQQQAIVIAPPETNMLVLAGPGAGKTRAVVHRCAYLTRMKRVRDYSILVLCYNHSSAVALRQRLKALLGQEARKILVYTFHGLAMRLLGHSFNLKAKKDWAAAALDFDHLITQATELLKGNRDIPGIPQDQVRERILSGIQYILVDEYQDIDASQYELISALAGRALPDEEEKLSILAVGDDDQSIYGFRQASVKYIRQFERDYKAQRYHLVQNFRSTQHIIATANRLIKHNRDRMKTEHAIRINDARISEPQGGIMERLDRVGKGRVQVITSQDVTAQSVLAVRELQRLRALWPDLDWSDCAVLARKGTAYPELKHFRSAAAHAEIPISLPLNEDEAVSPFRIREFHVLLDQLWQDPKALVTSACLRAWIRKHSPASSPWQAALQAVVENWDNESGGVETQALEFATFLTDYLREARREQRRGKGVHVSTVHACKGLEFRVVVLLDGNWEFRKESDREEERRLFYVGMSRAMDCLVLMQRLDAKNPHIPCVLGETCQERGPIPDWQYPLKEYRTLGMKDLYLDYAGSFQPKHRVHAVLRNLAAGDAVDFRPAEGNLCSQGQTIARLSKKGRALDWSGLNGRVTEGRVVAMVQRQSEDSEEKYQNRHKSVEWEIPLVELEWEAEHSGE